jgi:membrane protein DedA with SNARE-associated domain
MFDWIAGIVEEGGYGGILLLMLAENVFPPIPSELIMPLAGFLAAQGKLNGGLVIASGTLGSVLGAVFWYLVGRKLGLARLKRLAIKRGRWLGTGPGDLDRAHTWFTRHCGKAVFIGRLIPALRSLISIPAGISGMNWPRFLLFTMLGSSIWTALLACAGYLLEDQYARVAKWVDPISTGVLVVLVGTYLYRVATFKAASTTGE